MASFLNYSAFSHTTFVCYALTIRYSIYSVVGRSIASISDLGAIITLSLHASVDMAPQVRYISATDLPTIRYVLHIIYI